MNRRLYLLDGMALVFRAYYAFLRNPITNSKGVNTSPVFGFANTLLSIIDRQAPTHLAAAFDTPAPTFRHRRYPDYKAQREAPPEDILAALPLVDRLVQAFNIPSFRVPGFEADDVIGTLARRAEQAGFEVYMVTPDKDFAQLVSDRVFVYKPGRTGEGAEILGVPEVLAQWGVERIEQVVDMLGLGGDASDNIPGVPGVGEKTARRLLAQYGSVEGVLAHAGEIKGKLGERVAAHADLARLSRELATIHTAVPLEADLEALVRREPDRAAMKALFAELEFHTLAQRVLGGPDRPGPAAGAAAAPVQLELPGSGPAAGVEPEGEEEPPPAAEPAAEEAAEPTAEEGLRTVRDTPHRYRLVDEAKAQRELAARLAGLPAFCLDTETTGLDTKTAGLVGLSFAWEPGAAAYVPVPEDPAAAARLLDLFRPALESPDIGKTGHNLKFDLAVLRWNGVAVEGPLFDTLLAHFLVEPEQRHGLDHLAGQYLGYRPIPISELIGPDGPGQITLREVPVERVAEYAAEDADVALQLRSRLEPLLKERNQEYVFSRIECPLIPVLVDMECEGIALDTAALAEVSGQLAGRMAERERRAHELAGMPFNVNSPKQLGEVLFEVLRLDDEAARTRTGQYATHEQVLTRLAGRHEIARVLLDYREAAKLKSTYVDALPAAVLPRTGRVHTTFSQTATATGRLASSGPNLQNIPVRSAQGQEIRKAFIAGGPDFQVFSADYSQIELRIIAALSGDAALREAFARGQDIHAATASRIHGVPLERVSPEMRRQAKMVNYGLSYGMSAFGLSQRLGLPRAEADAILRQYFNQFPGVRTLIDRTVAAARERGYTETLAGRRRYLRDIASRNATARAAAERNAVNAPIQGSAADLIKLAMIEVRRRLRADGRRSRLLLQVHDELVFDLHRGEAESVPAMVREAMAEALPLEGVPVVVDLGVGPNWLEAH